MGTESSTCWWGIRCRGSAERCGPCGLTMAQARSPITEYGAILNPVIRPAQYRRHRRRNDPAAADRTGSAGALPCARYRDASGLRPRHTGRRGRARAGVGSRRRVWPSAARSVQAVATRIGTGKLPHAVPIHRSRWRQARRGPSVCLLDALSHWQRSGLGAGVLMTDDQMAPPPTEAIPGSATPRHPRRRRWLAIGTATIVVLGVGGVGFFVALNHFGATVSATCVQWAQGTSQRPAPC